MILLFSLLFCSYKEPVEFSGSNYGFSAFIIDAWRKKGDKYMLNIKTTFNNNSNDTLVFQSISCNWEDNYVINSADYSIEKGICFRTGPTNIIIPPKSDYIRVLTISTLKRPSLAQSGFTTIGIRLANSNIIDILDKSPIYVSNPLGLSLLSRR